MKTLLINKFKGKYNGNGEGDKLERVIKSQVEQFLASE